MRENLQRAERVLQYPESLLSLQSGLAAGSSPPLPLPPVFYPACPSSGLLDHTSLVSASEFVVQLSRGSLASPTRMQSGKGGSLTFPHPPPSSFRTHSQASAQVCASQGLSRPTPVAWTFVRLLWPKNNAALEECVPVGLH